MITFCVPVYDTPPWHLEQCLKSICNLDFDNYEILIVDDCSPSNVLENKRIKEIIQNCTKRIRIFRNVENMSVSGQCFYRLIEKVETKYAVIFHHDDWVIDPQFYINSLNIMEKFSHIKLVIGNSLLESNSEFFFPYLAPFKNSSRCLRFIPNSGIKIESEYNYDINFDPNFYFKKYPDLKIWGFSPEQHFTSHGLVENRQPNLFGDENYYLVDSKKFIKCLTLKDGKRIHPIYSSVVFNIESCLQGGFLTNKVHPTSEFVDTLGINIDEAFIYLYGLASLGSVVCCGKATTVRGEPKTSFSKSPSWSNVENLSACISYIHALFFSNWKNYTFKIFLFYAIKTFTVNVITRSIFLTFKTKIRVYLNRLLLPHPK